MAKKIRSKSPSKIRKTPKKVIRGVVERIIGARRKVGRDSAIQSELFKYIYAEDNIKSFEINLNQLLNYPVVRKCFNGFSSNIETMDCIPTVIMTNKNLICLYTSFFRVHSETISGFVTEMKRYERLFIAGEYVAAEEILDVILKKCGLSIWYIRNRFLLLKACDRLDDLQKYYNNLKSRAKSHLIISIIDNFFWLASSNDTVLFLDNFILNNIREYKGAGADELVALYSELYLPVGLYIERDISCLLPQIQRFTIVDQYLMLLDWFSDIVTNDFIAETSRYKINKNFILSKMKYIRGITEDPVLGQLVDFYSERKHQGGTILGANIITEYTAGQYHSALNLFNTGLYKLDNPFAYINIIARSKTYLGDITVDDKSLIGLFIGYLVEIYSLSKSAEVALSKMHEIAIQTTHLRCTHSLVLSLLKACQNQFKAKDISLASLRCLVTQNECTPLTVELALSKGLTADYFFRHLGGMNKNAPEYRVLKDLIYKNNYNAVYDENLIKRLEEIEPLVKDLYESKAVSLISAKMYIEAIEYSSSVLINRPETHICFPIGELVNIIEREGYISPHSAILCYFYNKNISLDKFYLLCEIVEDYVLDNKCERPSNIVEMKGSKLTNIEIYFFKNICTREVIDCMACFKNSIDLASERLKIIGLLVEYDLSLKSYLQEEKENIIDEIVVETGVAKIDSNKIQVNIEGVKGIVIPEVAMLLSSYWILPENNDSDDEYLIYDEGSEDEIKKGMVVGDRNSVIVRIIERVQHVFLYNEKYGLDKNISNEIRHGFFSNSMRYKLEEKHILLEADSNNKYKSSKFWSDIHGFLNSKTNDRIIKQLAIFSTAFNKLLKKTEDRLKITTTGDEKERMFQYINDPDDISKVRKYVETTRSESEVVDYIINELWIKTEECLELARDYINEELQDAVDKLFAELTENINLAKGCASLVDLSEAILQAKNGIREDIKMISEWLRRGDSVSFDDIPLSSVIDIARNSLNDIKGMIFDVKLNFSEEDKLVSGSYVKSIVLALINCFDNCHKYGANNNLEPIRVDVNTYGSSYKIRMTNRLTNAQYFELTSSKLQEIKTTMIGDASKHLLRSEGGSGLKKSYHALKSMDSKFHIDLKVCDEMFIMEMSYGLSDTVS